MRRWTAVLVTSAFALAACTSSGSGRPTSTPAPTSPTTSASPSAAATAVPGPRNLRAVPTPTAGPSFPSANTPSEQRSLLTAAFDSAQHMWQALFAQAGQAYHPARLHFYTSNVHSACGATSSDVGPFYCPADQGVYLDISFFVALHQRLGSQSNFGEAYVVAHEVGHHIQTLVGTISAVHQLQQQHPSLANNLSVRQELQADCYAGVWAHATYQHSLVGEADLRNALDAAASVGDDFLQKSATGTVQPETWTHGSSAQRQHWLATGFESGSPESCDTFAG